MRNFCGELSPPLFELSNETIEQVLKRLGIKKDVECSLENLAQLYQAWCTLIPFDNLMKTYRLAIDINAPLPGITAEEFFYDWFKHGVGGTCWAGNGALFALLKALKYRAEFIAGCMLADPLDTSSSLGHCSVVVTLDEREFIIDATLLHEIPIPLIPNESISPTFYFNVKKQRETLQIKWKPLGRKYSYFQINKRNLAQSEIFALHKASRGLSKFNGSPLIRMVKENTMIGIVKGVLIVRDNKGVEGFQSHDQFHFSQTLVNAFGIKQEFTNQLITSLKQMDT